MKKKLTLDEEWAILKRDYPTTAYYSSGAVIETPDTVADKRYLSGLRDGLKGSTCYPQSWSPLYWMGYEDGLNA